MSQNRSGNALVSCKGWVHTLGSFGGDNYLSLVERMQNLEGSWEKCPPMQKTRRLLAALNCDNIIYAIGSKCGYDEKTRTKTVERFNPNDKWEYACEMNAERSSHAACVMQGKI